MAQSFGRGIDQIGVIVCLCSTQGEGVANDFDRDIIYVDKPVLVAVCACHLVDDDDGRDGFPQSLSVVGRHRSREAQPSEEDIERLGGHAKVHLVTELCS